MRTQPIRILILLLVLFSFAALSLASCTRNRTSAVETPVSSEATSEATGAAPAAEQAQGQAEPGVTAPATPAADETPEADVTPTPEEPATMDYEVKPGDTLASIADKFFTDAETVRRLNYILGDDIRVGQRLVVPKLEPTPLPTAEPFTYTVEAGDSLGALALKFNVDAKEIMRANDISDPNALRVGQNIVIPGYSVSISAAPQAAEGGNAGEATGAGGDEVVHVVQPGEGLFEIAALYGVNASAIAQANGVNTPNLLRAGQKLIIPGITQSEARRARSTIHVVQSGETLISIAQRYGVSAEAIAAENELANPNALRVGQELMIPNQ